MIKKDESKVTESNEEEEGDSPSGVVLILVPSDHFVLREAERNDEFSLAPEPLLSQAKNEMNSE